MNDSFKKTAHYTALTITALLVFNVVKALIKPADLERYYVTVLSIITFLFVVMIGFFIIRRKEKVK